jgi:serine/threonine-protein kinase RsbW
VKSSEPLRLAVSALAESVPVVRHALIGVAEAAGLTALQTKDIEIAVTEACTNAVLHAYGDAPGVIDVAAWLDARQLVVTVRDHGAGMSNRSNHVDGLGLGIPLMHDLADQLVIQEPATGGTEVRLTFLRVNTGPT